MARALNLAVASIALSVRAFSEMKDAGVAIERNGAAGRAFNKFADNKGLALSVSGAMTL